MAVLHTTPGTNSMIHNIHAREIAIRCSITESWGRHVGAHRWHEPLDQGQHRRLRLPATGGAEHQLAHRFHSRIERLRLLRAPMTSAQHGPQLCPSASHVRM